MRALSKKKLAQALLPLFLISMMLGTIAYQGLLMSESTLLSPNDSIEGFLDSLPIDGLPMMNTESLQEASSSASPWDSVGGDPRLPDTLDVGKFLSDNTGDYQKIWEPWLTKAGIHDIAVSPNGEFLAVGGGYLYDNELHVYRWNDILGKYVRAWESGDGIFQGDIRAVTLGDTDQNLFLEMAGACSDGYVYVFEQTHIFDPNTRTETRFDLVWTSPYVGSAWGVEIADTDLDKIADIVVGAWDAGLAWFEYSNHSGYPYTPEHWIDYREAFRLPIDGHIQSLTTADINGNGLPDVVVGTQEGYLYIIENDGTVIGDETGISFSIPQDNRYRVIWESKGPVWAPIMKLDSGQLDSDAAFEAVVVARGQGVYALDYDATLNDFILTKMVRPLESWETPKNQFGEDLGYPLDHYVDWMLYPSTGSVTFTNSTGFVWNEPWNYGDNPQDYILNPANEVVKIYPYNSSIAQKPETPSSLYTKFDAIASPEGIASAILDFGKDEEATGDARPGIPTALTGYDLEIYCDSSPNLATINLSVSPDLEMWEPIANTSITVSGTSLLVDIDAALAARQWLFARYLNITVHSDGVLAIDAIYTKLVNKQLDSACSAIIGQVNLEWNNPNEQNKIIIGTVEGRLLVYQYDNVAGSMALLFDSYTDERYVLGTNVWDIAAIPEGPRTTVPTWIAEEGNALISDRGVMFRGHEYKLFTDAKTWAQAQADCAAQGGHLVTISDADENEFVRQLAGGARVWIGLTDNEAWGASELSFEWITGQSIQPTDYANWAPGEPNDWLSNEDYGEMYGNGRWNDWTSTAYSSYICEWEHDYGVVTNPSYTWAQAKANAEARGGHLVAITTPEEYELVNDLIEAEIGSNPAWIGFWDETSTDNYSWVTGEGWWIDDTQNTTNAYWNTPGEPDKGAEDYVYMQNGVWVDTLAAQQWPYWVVEWEFGFGRMTPDVVSSISITSIDWSSRSIILANSSDPSNPFRTYYYTGEGYRSYQNSQGLSLPKGHAVSLLGGQYSGISAAFSSFKTESKYSADFGRMQSIPTSFSFAVFDTNNPYSPDNPTQYTTAEIRVYRAIWSWGGAWGYWYPYTLHDQETTGQLATVLKMSQIQPTMVWGDMDGDGREDMVIANG
ncbi:MAG: lectin-like protein, partial [Candidatus Thorarchaeota archaeon]